MPNFFGSMLTATPEPELIEEITEEVLENGKGDPSGESNKLLVLWKTNITGAMESGGQGAFACPV